MVYSSLKRMSTLHHGMYPPPLNLNPTTNHLPEFKYHLLKFSRKGTISINEHLVVLSNACHNIGENENDTCMTLFVNSLEGKVVVDFFKLSPKVFLTWVNYHIGLNKLMDNLKVHCIC